MKQKIFRNEIKFIIDAVQASLIEGQIATICRHDSYILDTGFYDIKSVYFDTIDDKYYYENLAGVNVRNKWRIRIYNNDDSIIKLERKETESGLKHKASCNLLRDQVEQILVGNIMVDCREGQNVLHEFQLEHLNCFLLPKVIVNYRRKPYVYDAGNVRITFDYHICASLETSRFFDNELQYFPVIDDSLIVLEVKYDDVLPYAIRSILNDSGALYQGAFSKYAISREEMTWHS